MMVSGDGWSWWHREREREREKLNDEGSGEWGRWRVKFLRRTKGKRIIHTPSYLTIRYSGAWCTLTLQGAP